MNRAWIVLLVTLSAAPVAKLGDVQAVEMAQVLWLLAAAPVFLYLGLRIPCSGLWRRYGLGYLAFLVLCLAVSALALRLPFYSPPDTSVLKRPGLLSMARIFELSLAIAFMLISAQAFAARRRLLRLALDVYLWVGLLGAVVSIGSWVLREAGGSSTWFVYGPDARVRGFFNEGGPYGIYLVSVGLVALLRVPRRRWPLIPLAAALLLSGSKTGLLAAFVLAMLGVAFVGSPRRRIAMASASVLVLAALFFLFQGKLYGYLWSYLNIDEALAYRPGDPSLVMGRIAASIVVPRMIAAHPVLGIGVGNYSLMRNDPDYLQGLPAVDDWDLPGLGLIGSAAELGVPLTLLLLGLLLRPVASARRTRAPAILAVTASFPAVAFLAGVNLNFFYPWLVGAFALSAESSQC